MRKIFIAFLIFCITVIMFNGSINADTGTAHIAKGQFKSGAKNVTYYYSPSVASYGYTSHLNHAIANWNGVSSNVVLATTVLDTAADTKVYVGYNSLPSGYIARTEFFSYNSIGQVVTHSDWDIIYGGTKFQKATIRIDDYKRVQTGYTNWDKLVKLAGHEIGHTLGLLHFENSPAHNSNDWMYTGPTNSPYPSSNDKSHLRSKWGN